MGYETTNNKPLSPSYYIRYLHPDISVMCPVISIILPPLSPSYYIRYLHPNTSVMSYYIQGSIPGEESELLKYKKLWKDNLTHKEQFKWLLESMKQKLENAHQRIVVAEDLCANNVANFHKLEHKVREEMLALRRYRDFEDVGENKFQKVFWGVSGQLEASRNENQYIRFFLQNTVLPKEKDFLKLKANMETKADEYRQHIERETPPPLPPPPVEEEKPDKRERRRRRNKTMNHYCHCFLIINLCLNLGFRIS
ncbi:uncharacterized protein CEXT_762941 [Caerostris extrusa]|uniref:Uncharacterized protein n=1 Tax=Caerostris extrusa TaxID=172846 RepID=A0AAV4PJA6_CAEEX|nr:uncharacterized protein CEXT_762941 [Caerostris extrusa]